MSSQNDIICESCGKIYITVDEKWCRPCVINNLEKNFTNWTSGNEKIDNFIQKMQSKIESTGDIIVEWIPYNQFNNVKKTNKDGFATAIWKDGLLKYNIKEGKHERRTNTEVTLKFLNNSQYVISDLLNEAKAYSIKVDEYNIPKIYGISQNPDTNDYIIVLDNSFCKEYGVATAIWKNGLLKYDEKEIKYEREPNKEVILKCLNNSQNVISDLLIKAKAYSIKLNYEYDIPKIYGISQNPDTKDYIIVLNNSYCKECGEIYTVIWGKWCKPCQINNLKQNFTNRTSRNEKIDEFIQEMQFKIESTSDIIVEWIPYDQFNNVVKIGKDGIATAIWKNGLLKYDEKEIKYEREPNKEVTLKCLNNSQNVISNLLNEAKAYSIKVDDIVYVDNIPKIYGISQNLNTNEYVIVFQDGYYCKNCVYLAIWKDGPLKYDMELKRTTPNKEVALKCLYNSQNITNEFLNEVNAYSINFNDGILKIYGISQNPDTNDYIIVFEYASGGNLNNENNNIIRSYRWNEKLDVLSQIVKGLKNIHENKLAHRDFHTGNILVSIGYNSYYGYSGNSSHDIYISDMGLCGEVSNIDKTKIYGVMPFVAPEVLRGKPYNQAADVYSFGMIMYYIATGRQPFANRAHDSGLALNICNGIRPEINEQEAPKFYIELMKNCWDPDPDKRPSAIEIEKLIPKLSCEDKEINKQIEKAEEYRKTNILSTGNSQSIHPQALEITDFTEEQNEK
ncbi:uncharacterized protein OCT59_025578 [Rhizophagus irregularis]|nr:hypothetical protein OCT59_025578 [Rhizophagus irregularis]